MQWVCEICGYVHDDEELPDTCPVCGAPKDKFSEWNEEDVEELEDDDLDKRDEDFENDLYGDLEE